MPAVAMAVASESEEGEMVDTASLAYDDPFTSNRRTDLFPALLSSCPPSVPCPNDQQIPALRPTEYSRISKSKKTVQRAYGGSRCAGCVRDRWVGDGMDG